MTIDDALGKEHPGGAASTIKREDGVEKINLTPPNPPGPVAYAPEPKKERKPAFIFASHMLVMNRKRRSWSVKTVWGAALGELG